MNQREQFDDFYTWILCWISAVAAWAGGLYLAGWAPNWLGDATDDRAVIVLTRLCGACILALGCWYAAVAGMPDAATRRRALAWLLGAYVVMFCSILLVRNDLPWPGAGDRTLMLAGGALAILWLWLSQPLDVTQVDQPWIAVMNRVRPVRKPRLRSQYEQQIRLAASQEERNRLARDLHDSVKQQIFAIQTAAATVDARLGHDPDGAREALRQIGDSSAEAMSEMDAMLDQLRAAPVGNSGLVEALKRQCAATGFRTGAAVKVHVGELPPTEALAPGAHQAILRVAQEALANVGRHARAKNINVSLASSGRRLELEVRDDGAGFDTQNTPQGMGMRNMQARADEFGGTVRFESQRGAGTTVRFSVPHARPDWRLHASKSLLHAVFLLAAIVCAVRLSPWISSVVPWFALGLLRELLAWRRMSLRQRLSS